MVIQDTQQYMFEAMRQLNNTNHYIPLPHPLATGTQKLVNNILHDLYTKGFITHKQKLFLMGPNPHRPRQFYLLPKIHADPQGWTIPRGRPIVSDCDSETYNIAEYIDLFLNPISQLHSSYLRDTYHFIDTISKCRMPLSLQLT